MIQELRALSGRAAPAPWRLSDGPFGGYVIGGDGLPLSSYEIAPAGLELIVAMRNNIDKLLDAVECIPRLLDWIERYRGADSGLSPEEYYIVTESALNALERLEKA